MAQGSNDALEQFTLSGAHRDGIGLLGRAIGRLIFFMHTLAQSVFVHTEVASLSCVCLSSLRPCPFFRAIFEVILLSSLYLGNVPVWSNLQLVQFLSSSGINVAESINFSDPSKYANVAEYSVGTGVGSWRSCSSGARFVAYSRAPCPPLYSVVSPPVPVPHNLVLDCRWLFGLLGYATPQGVHGV